MPERFLNGPDVVAILEVLLLMLYPHSPPSVVFRSHSEDS